LVRVVLPTTVHEGRVKKRQGDEVEKGKIEKKKKRGW